MASGERFLSKSRYGIGISWDHSGSPVDVDLQAVAADDSGSIVDAVYYNNLKALRSITHSGDEITGERAGMDEVIWVNLAKLPENIRLIIFVVAAYSGGRLRDVKNGTIHVLEERQDVVVSRHQLEHSEFNVDAVAMMVRLPGKAGWSLRIIEEPAQEGRHFIDILEPTLGNLIRGVIPGAPKRQKVAFAMEKGSVVDLPATVTLGEVSTGLGWDVSRSVKSDVDLDVSAVFFGKDGSLGAVFFGNTEENGFKHSGDNLTGEGDGDDEIIGAALDRVPPQVEQVFFVVNIYTNNVTFEQVSNAYCRIFDRSGSEMARYVLREGRGERGLIIARLFREHGARWGFQALGKFCRGKTWKDAVPDMEPIARTAPRDFQLRSSASVASFGASPPTSSYDGRPSVAQPQPPPHKKASGCSLM